MDPGASLCYFVAQLDPRSFAKQSHLVVAKVHALIGVYVLQQRSTDHALVSPSDPFQCQSR